MVDDNGSNLRDSVNRLVWIKDHLLCFL